MEEFSSCCGAGRHHIFEDLCADCLEHCEFEEEEDDYHCDIVNEF